MTTTSWLEAALLELRVAEPYLEAAERLLERAGGRAADCAQEFAVKLLEARERGLYAPESIALATCLRWLRRERLDDSTLEPIMLEGTDGRERERALQPLPAPAPAVRR